MKTLNACALILAVSLTACGKGSYSPGVAPVEQEITGGALPSFVGSYESPAARLRILPDGRFMLETKEEQVRWYRSSSSGSTDQTQHYASCKVLRRGTLQVIQRGSMKLLRLKPADRELIAARVDSRSPGENPVRVCETALGAMSASTGFDLWVSAQGQGQFLLSNHRNDQPYYLFLDSASAELVADSSLYGEYSLLFTGRGDSAVVTDLLAASPGATFRAQSTGKRFSAPSSLEVNFALRTLRYVDPDCAIDSTVAIEAVSTGSRVLVRSVGRAPGGGAHHARGYDCDSRRAALAANDQQDLFDITNPLIILGLGGMRGGSLSKTDSQTR